MKGTTLFYILWFDFEIFYTIHTIKTICYILHCQYYKSEISKARNKAAKLWRKALITKIYLLYSQRDQKLIDIFTENLDLAIIRALYY